MALVSVTRGGKNPLFVEYTSSFAEALGVVVPIPVCASDKETINNRCNMTIIFFIVRLYYALAPI